MYRLTVIATLCAVAGSTALSGDADPQRVSRQFRVVGYLPDYRKGDLRTSWGQHLTDIVYFSIEPKASGELDTSRFDQKVLRELRSISEDSGIRILICLGGWGRSKGFAPMATNPTRRRNFIRQLTEFCRKHGLAGADFDWEFPEGRQQEEAYSVLLAETKDAFRAHGMIVTVAVGSNKRLTEDAYRAVDYVHLMSYDHGARHATYKDSVADVERQLAFGVPKEKLCLGVPFYGRNMKNRGDASAYSRLVTDHGPSSAVDEVAGIYFNGIDTIQKKTRYAMEYGLGGLMIWEISQDTSDKTSLLRAINRTVSGTAARKRSNSPGEQQDTPPQSGRVREDRAGDEE